MCIGADCAGTPRTGVAMWGNVGTELRQARERAQLSLQDIATRTKIRVPLLEAIEREEFERLPAGLLTRGYLRAYAREVGLDPESIVRQYVAAFEPERLAPEPPAAPPREMEWEPDEAARTRWAILAPAIPLILAAIFVLRVNQSPDAVPDVPDPPATAVATMGQPVAEVAAVDPVQAVATRPERLRLEIHPTAVTWVEATVDGTRVMYDLVDAGDRRVIEADTEIALRVGDAAAFAYSIDGVPGRILGGPGEVRDMRITRDTYQDFLQEAE